jgi:hypothetical protein
LKLLFKNMFYRSYSGVGTSGRRAIYFAYMYENRTMTPFEIVLRGHGG